jgi:Ner family transcriptional regulator
MDSIERAAKIKADLFTAGYVLLDIDRAFDLPLGTASRTLREPNPRGEVAIAAALACKPQKLWPERYWPSGQRKSPQPLENYRKPAPRWQRRIVRSA